MADNKGFSAEGETAATRRGIERLTERTMEHVRKQGGYISEEAARKQARNIALRTNIDKGLK